MKQITHILLAVAALGVTQAHAQQMSLVCDSPAHFALADGRMMNHNDEPVAGCKSYRTGDITIVETDIPGASYALIAKVRVAGRVGYGPQDYIRTYHERHVVR